MTEYNPPFLILKAKPGTRADQLIAKDSGIVGVLKGGDPNRKKIEVSYEGNLYQCENLQKWEERVMHAADRLATGYPTVARRILPFEQFETVGVIGKDASGHWIITHHDGTITELSRL
jgi:hypothetical protein